jgi:hypothetical protein
MSHLNPFLVISIALNISIAIWYFYKSGTVLGFLFLGYAFCSIVTLFIKIQ